MCNDDEAALLRGVLDHPDLDLPRLVLADWWEESGRPERAEFVRVQVELASRKWEPTGTEWREYDALRRRGRELFRDSGREWWDDLPGLYRSTGDDMRIKTAEGWEYEVRRGFVESVACDLATFMGAVCGRCEGSGVAQGADRPFEYEGHGTWPGPCSGPCKGDRTYRTPGIAPRLFASQPVTEVVISDRGTMHGRTWYREDYRGVADPQLTLPTTLFDLLPYAEHQGGYGCQTTWKEYLSITPASALNTALVAYGRANAEGMSHECGRCERQPGWAFTAGNRLRRCPDCDGNGKVRRPGLPPLAPTAKETVS